MDKFTSQIVFHPGLVLAAKFDEMKLTDRDISLLTNIPEKQIKDILNCDASLTEEIALEFEKLTKIKAKFLMSKQHKYDVYLEKVNKKKIING